MNVDYCHESHLENILEWMQTVSSVLWFLKNFSFTGYILASLIPCPNKKWSPGHYAKKHVRTFSSSIGLGQLSISKWYLTWKRICFTDYANPPHWLHLHVWNNKAIAQTQAGFLFGSSYLHVPLIACNWEFLFLWILRKMDSTGLKDMSIYQAVKV